MAKLRSKDVLQIDATIIAGLLILLTIQTATEPPTVIESFKENEKLATEAWIQNSTLTKYLEKLESEKKNIPSEDVEKLQRIQNQIDETKFELWKLTAELEQRVDIAKKKVENWFLNIYESRANFNNLIFRVIAITMIMPFAVSIAWEVVATFDKKENDDLATKGSKVLMIGGMLVLILGLYFIQQIGS